MNHDLFADSIASYAIGALPPSEAVAVRQHLNTCPSCREEYRLLAPAVTMLATSAETCRDAAGGALAPPSPLLKQRIMRRVRQDASLARTAAPATTGMRRMRPIVWPAYAVAAACLAIALFTSIFDIALKQRVSQQSRQIAALTVHADALAEGAETQKQMVADLMASDAERYTVTGGEVVKRGGRLYLAMTHATMPPKGKVYQAWFLHQGAKTMSPSMTFVPDRSGVAVLSLPGNARQMAAVAVSVEPAGGSKQPTSKPTFIVKFS